MSHLTYDDYVNAQSETDAWQQVLDFMSVIVAGCNDVRRGSFMSGIAKIRAAAGRVHDLAVAMQLQANRGIHRNPPLVVYGNPPLRRRGRRIGGGSGSFRFVSRMSPNVHEVRYTHEEDGKDYRHPFEHAEMWAIERGRGQRDVLLTGESGEPMWEDFD